MNGKIKLNEKECILLTASEETISFMKQYFYSYYEVEEESIQSGEEQVVRKIKEMEEELSDSEKIKLKATEDVSELQIHYDQKACLYRHEGMAVIQYDRIEHILIIKDDTIFLYPNKEDLNYKYIPMRIVRDLIYFNLIVNGFYEVHAASVSLNGKGIMLIGERGAGKTTLLFQLLRNPDIHFVSNDKTFLNLNTMEMKGYPVSINIFKNITYFVPELSGLFNSNNTQHHYQHVEWDEYVKKDKRTFSIQDIQKFMHFPIKATSTCQVVLMPQKEIGGVEEVVLDETVIHDNIRYSKFTKWLSLLYGKKLESKEIVRQKNKDILYIKVYRDCDIDKLLEYIEKRLQLMKPNILFLNPSRRIELIEAFAEVGNIHIACYDELDPCMLLFEKKRKIKQDMEVDELLHLCKEWNINLIIPWLEKDMLVLYEQWEQFRSNGIRIACGTSEGTKKAFSKKTVNEELINQNICNMAHYFNRNENFEYPIVIKPDIGSGSFGVKIIRNEKQLEAYYEPGKLLMKYYSGDEYTVDAFCCNGDAVVSLPRRRIKHRAGECLISKLEQKEELVEQTRLICEKLVLDGPINIQFIYDEDNHSFICTDINPRFGGGVILSIRAGVNFPKLCVDYYLGKRIDKQDYEHVDWQLISTRWLKSEITKSDAEQHIDNVDFMMI